MPTRLFRPTAGRLPRAIIDAWRGVPSAVAADRLGGRSHADPGIRPLRPFASGTVLAGSAVTAWCEPADYGPVHHAIAVAEPGDVIVVAAGGRRDAAMIGELLSGSARLKGIAGVVVDGAVRDVGILSQWSDFHVFARWITPRGPASMERGSVNETVVVGGIAVSPNDLVIGDDDGLVFVPRAVAEDQLEPCLARVAAEKEWESALAAGASTIETFNVPSVVKLLR
jgi:regulator of RNase E activity RraA